ncbi:MAG: cytochrome c [Planctomycetota bacterium]
MFRSNGLYALTLAHSRDANMDAASEDVSGVITGLFGSPDEPRWPVDLLADPELRRRANDLLDMDRLRQAAGPQSSDQDDRHSGLYREHCVICHGVGGDGAGPASRFQSPYPRDFRAGLFKWKSTPRSEKPTREDLHRVLQNGLPGSPMPSFSTVAPEDREALVDYVIYLAVRGQVERELLAVAVDEFAYDGQRPSEAAWQLRSIKPSDSKELTEAQEAVVEVVEKVIGDWVSSSVKASPVPAIPGDEFWTEETTLAKGEALFHGPVANCAGCHGKSGAGGVPLVDYDDWTKEFTTRIGVSPDDRDAVKPFRKAGALPPRQVEPRRLAEAWPRGGGDPATLYRRIQHGISGTPMPGVMIDAERQDSEPNGVGLSQDEALALVAYVRQLMNHDRTL